MSSDPYSQRVRDLFFEPAHSGRIDGATGVQIDDQGLRLSLCAELDGDTLTALRFQAWGCPHVIAAAEAFCEEYQGRAAADLLEFSASGLMQSLPVPVEKTGRILVLEDAVRALGKSLHDASNKH